MRRILSIAVLAAALVFSASLATAQEKNPNQAQNKEAFFQARLKLIAQEMQLSEETVQKLEPIYRAYRNDIQHAAFHRGAKIRKENVNEQNAHEYLCGRLMNNIATSSVKLKYVQQFEEVITPIQIEKLYRIEDKLGKEARKLLKE